MIVLKQLVLSAGMLASLAGSAHAQFVADAAVTGEPAVHQAHTEESRASTQTIVITNEKGEVYRVIIKGDVIEQAWVNDEKIDPMMVVRKDGNLIFLSKDGSPEQTFKVRVTPIPTTPQSPRAVVAPGSVSFFAGDEPGDEVELIAKISRPPVMLGINLSEPGEALRTQLGLGDMSVILVDEVIDGLPAQKAGLKKHDIIVSLDGSKGASSADLTKVLSGKESGNPLNIVVLRGGEKIEVTAKLVPFDGAALGRVETGFTLDSNAPFPSLQRLRQRSSDGNVRVWVSPELDAQRQEMVLAEKEAMQRMNQAEREALKHMLNAEEMRAKIEEAMREAERRVLELRGDQLFIREADETRAIAEQTAKAAAERLAQLEGRLRERVPELQEGFEDRLVQIEARFDSIENRINQRIEEIGNRMERLADVLDRLIDRLDDQD